MKLLRLLRKNLKLTKLMNRLGTSATNTGTPDFRKMIDDVICASGEPTDKELAQEELYDLVEADPDLRQIMTVYGATRETLKLIYDQLCVHGAGQWVKGAYVPAAAVATNPSLLHILRTLHEPTALDEYNRWLKLSHELLQYFDT